MSGYPKLVKIIVPSSFVTHKPIFGIKNSDIVVPLARSEYLTINLNIKKMFDPTTVFKLDDYGLKPKNMTDNTLINTSKRKENPIIPELPSKYALIKKNDGWDFVTTNDIIREIFIFKNYVKDVENTKKDKDDLIFWLAQGDTDKITAINGLLDDTSKNANDLYTLLDNTLFIDGDLVQKAFEKLTAIKAAAKEEAAAKNNAAISSNTNTTTQSKTEEVNPLTAGFIVTCTQKTLNNSFDLNEITVKYQNPKDPSQLAKIIELLVPINLTGADNTIQAEVLKHLKFILDFLYIFKSSPIYNDLITNVFLDKTSYNVATYTEDTIASSSGLDKSLFGALIFPQIVSLLKNTEGNVLIGNIKAVEKIEDFGKVIVYFKAHIVYVKIMITLAYYIAKFNLTMEANKVSETTVPTTTVPTTNSILNFIKALLPAAAAPADTDVVAAAPADPADPADTDAAAAANAANILIGQLATINKFLTEITPTPLTMGGGYSKKRRNRGKQSKRKRVRRRMTEKREM